MMGVVKSVGEWRGSEEIEGRIMKMRRNKRGRRRRGRHDGEGQGRSVAIVENDWLGPKPRNLGADSMSRNRELSGLGQPTTGL
jgi:hypothetical protein